MCVTTRKIRSAVHRLDLHSLGQQSQLLMWMLQTLPPAQLTTFGLQTRPLCAALCRQVSAHGTAHEGGTRLPGTCKSSPFFPQTAQSRSSLCCCVFSLRKQVLQKGWVRFSERVPLFWNGRCCEDPGSESPQEHRFPT